MQNITKIILFSSLLITSCQVEEVNTNEEVTESNTSSLYPFENKTSVVDEIIADADFQKIMEEENTIIINKPTQEKSLDDMLKNIETTRKRNKEMNQIMSLKIKLVEAELTRREEKGIEDETSFKVFVDSLENAIEYDKVEAWLNPDVPLESEYFKKLCKKFPIITDNYDLYLEAKKHYQRKLEDNSSLRASLD